MSDLIETRRSEFAERILRLDGKPFSLANYEMYRTIYDCGALEMLLFAGRQVGKSTSCANFISAECGIIPHFRVLYSSPTREQTRKFSSTRVGKIMSHSDLFRRAFMRPTLSSAVLQRMLVNGSEIHFTYAMDDPDRARGNTADRLFSDETQDVHYDSVIPVLRECLSASNYQYILYAGTPKTMENSMEFLWRRSSQHRWGMRCPGCSRINFIMDERSIGLKGPICTYCGHLLVVRPNYDPVFRKRTGFWVPTYPENPRLGFHLPQPIFPMHAESELKWSILLSKMPGGNANYSRSRFRNEILGMSDSVGSRIITREQLQALCKDYTVNSPPDKLCLKGISNVAAGIDWGGGGKMRKGARTDVDVVSRTVLWIWGQLGNESLKLLYFKIFPSDHPVQDVEEIATLLKMFEVQRIMGDAGEGHFANNAVQEKLGYGKIFPVQYGAYKKPIIWNGQDRYLLDRTTALDAFFWRILLGRRVVLANIKQMETPINDFLAEYEQVTEQGDRRVWRHAPGEPDDCLHAAVFGWVAMMHLIGDFEPLLSFQVPEQF